VFPKTIIQTTSGLLQHTFLSILSIKCRNWFYWADRAERAERAESKESPAFMHILGYVAKNQQLEKFGVGRIPPSPPAFLHSKRFNRASFFMLTVS
jgi:hypothetical protein